MSEPTLFSQERFVSLIVDLMLDFFPKEIELWSVESLAGVKTLHSFGRQTISLSPFGLYAHPSSGDDLCTTVKSIVKKLKTPSTLSFEWNVRFDHTALAESLHSLGLESTRTLTQVLPIVGDYEATFASYNSTARNLVRRARRERIVIRRSSAPEDVSAYYDIYMRLAAAKSTYGFLYPKPFFDGLLKLGESVIFIVAEHQGRVIGGAWFFRDGESLLYWHSSMERKFSKQSPMYAILDYAIEMAHEEERKFFNFGGSSGIASLEQFKAKWGAEPKSCWRFYWHNPLWKSVQRVRTYLRAYAG